MPGGDKFLMFHCVYSCAPQPSLAVHVVFAGMLTQGPPNVYYLP